MTELTQNSSALNDHKDSAPVLAEALLITEQMLAVAQNNEWDVVTKLEEKRRDAIAKCFACSIPENQQGLFSEALAAMLQMNEELVALVEVARDEVAVRRTDQQYKKRSVSHYLDIEDTR